MFDTHIGGRTWFFAVVSDELCFAPIPFIAASLTVESTGMMFFSTSSSGPGLREILSFRLSDSLARFSLVCESCAGPSAVGSAVNTLLIQHSSSSVKHTHDAVRRISSYHVTSRSDRSVEALLSQPFTLKTIKQRLLEHALQKILFNSVCYLLFLCNY